MNPRPGRYSKYLRFINISVHIFFINAALYYFDKTVFYNTVQIVYINFSWLIIAYITNFYNTYRYISLTKLLSRLILQSSIFFLAYFTFYAFTQQAFNLVSHVKIFATILTGLLGVRLFFYFSLRAYRKHGGNFRKVIIIGSSPNDQNLKDFFTTRSEYGYRFLGFFSDKIYNDINYKGNTNQSFDFILDN